MSSSTTFQESWGFPNEIQQQVDATSYDIQMHPGNFSSVRHNGFDISLIVIAWLSASDSVCSSLRRKESPIMCSQELNGKNRPRLNYLLMIAFARARAAALHIVTEIAPRAQ
jgi:hypothetical protein